MGGVAVLLEACLSHWATATLASFLKEKSYSLDEPPERILPSNYVAAKGGTVKPHEVLGCLGEQSGRELQTARNRPSSQDV